MEWHLVLAPLCICPGEMALLQSSSLTCVLSSLWGTLTLACITVSFYLFTRVFPLGHRFIEHYYGMVTAEHWALTVESHTYGRSPSSGS